MLRVDVELVSLGGALHVCQLPGTWFLGKRLLGIDRELTRLSPLVRAIVMVLGAATVSILLSLGGLVVWFAKDLVRTEFGLALCFFLGLFWAVRLMLQIYYYRCLSWPRSRAGRVAHFLLVFVFATQAIAYLTGAALGVIAGGRP